MADVISNLSSLLTTLSLPSPSSSSTSTSLRLLNRNPFRNNSSLYASPHSWTIGFISRKQLRPSLKINARSAETTDQPKWWEKTAGPNMIDIHSTQEFLTSLSLAGEKLVIVEFYGTWCASCRALFPKLCRTALEHPEVLFLKVNFDENKPMCKSLNVKVLPYFHFYRGADGQLESFSCSLAKFQKVKDAIEMHNTDRCSIGPPKGIGELAMEITKD